MVGSGDPNSAGQSNYKTFGRNRSLRLPLFDYGSPHVFFVTIGTQERQPYFSQVRYAEAVIDCLASCRERYCYAVYAYCLMPDHLHLLVTSNAAASNATGAKLQQFVGGFKSLSTRALWKEGHQGVIWQSHYYDHVVRNEEGLSRIAE